MPDSGAVYGNRGNGFTYGWSAANNYTVDRDNGISPDQRYDTLNYLPAQNTGVTWDIAVPNGQYQVHLVVGDAVSLDPAETESSD